MLLNKQQEGNHMHRRLLILLAGSVILLGGCSLAPKYQQPETPISAHWPQGEAYTKPLASR